MARVVRGRLESVALHWASRLLLDRQGIDLLFADGRLQDRRLLLQLKLPSEVVSAPSPSSLDSALRRRMRAHRIILDGTSGRTPFERNIGWLADNLGLCALEAQILTFIAASALVDVLGRALELFGPLRAAEVIELVAVAVDGAQSDVERALRHDGKLIRSGLVWLSLETAWRWDSKIGLLQGLAEQLPVQHEDPSGLLRSNFRRAPTSPLNLGAFDYLGLPLEVLRGILSEASGTRRPGVNVLLHGIPGAGKTSLTRALAVDLSLSAYEVAHSDRFGNALKGEARLNALAMAQSILSGKERNLVVADEAEELFASTEESRWAHHQPAGGRVTKARLNALLEENDVPTLWIVNDLQALHPAFRRRFDLILEVPTPPRSVRTALIRQAPGASNLSESWVSRASELDLSPGVLLRTMGVAARLTSDVQDADNARVVETILNGQLVAMGRRPLPSPSQVQRDVPFRHDCLNVDTDIPTLLSGLQRKGAGRILCYGLPGAGKSAFGRHLAEVTGRSLILRRPSDLLGRYVGDTEKALAEAFATATRDGAVLQLDEVDGFLRHRAQAQHSWEVSQTNELLTQMEVFQGLLVVTTNQVDALDAASLRRFDAKLNFQPPTRDQRRELFETFLSTLDLPCPTSALRAVEAMSGLTQGDFALVLRQGALNPIDSADDFVNRLARELALKPEHRRRAVGFGGSA